MMSSQVTEEFKASRRVVRPTEEGCCCYSQVQIQDGITTEAREAYPVSVSQWSPANGQPWMPFTSSYFTILTFAVQAKATFTTSLS